MDIIMKETLSVEQDNITALLKPKPMVEDRGVAVFENAFSPTYCKTLINLYQKMEAAGAVSTRREAGENISETFKEDTSWGPHFSYVEGDISLEMYKECRETLNVFWGSLYPQYRAKYGSLDNASSHVTRDIKLQKTLPGQGYHVWHYEHDSKKYSSRIMAWILYLDDVKEGGETEFLYLQKRIAPKAGTLILFPSNFI